MPGSICAVHGIHVPAAIDPDDYPVDLLPPTGLASSSEDYYPTVAINALMRMLRDQSLVAHQTQVVKSLFYIFQALGMAAVPYLAKVCPHAHVADCATALLDA